MKILFISIPSIHVVRWLENLKHTDHEIYWLNILGTEKIDTSDKVIQIVNWKKRRLPYIKGEYFLRKKMPQLYAIVSPYLEISANQKLEEIILQINPSVIHSFEMQTCCYSIIKTMNKFSKIKWIYSCWGSDLFYYKNFKNHNRKLKSILKRVNYLHTDCIRDSKLATELGFNGENLGVIPGGTGYKLEELQKFKMPVLLRKIILVKGYEHLFGRGLNVVKALQEIAKEIKDYDVMIFAAHSIVIDYIKQNKLPFSTLDRHGLKHEEVTELMGKSLVYIGNSISDGMSNTLLEAIVMGAFPIQSNPGKVSEEIINNNINGLIINNPESTLEIKNLILDALKDKDKLMEAEKINSDIAISRLDFTKNKEKVIAIYNSMIL